MWPVSATGCGTSPRTGCRCRAAPCPARDFGRPLEPNFEAFVALVPEHEREAMREAFRTLVRMAVSSMSIMSDVPTAVSCAVCGRCPGHRAWCGRPRADGHRHLPRRDRGRRTQALLEARERRLDAIIGSLAEGVVVRDREAGLPWPTTRRPGSPAWPCRPAWPASRIGRMGDA